MDAYRYPIALAVLSLLVMAGERIRPWRPGQAWLRPGIGWDVVHLVFNGHFLGVILYDVFARVLQPRLSALGTGRMEELRIGAAWPFPVQVVVVLLVVDFLQWCVHNLLHRVPVLWHFHQVHHSVVDGQMDWIVSFRFHWFEVVVYKALLYLPLLPLGLDPEAFFIHAVVGTLVGHLNHANLDLSWGPLRYVLNSPRMHIWHHDRDNPRAVNFGIIFSCWDWMFGTARIPAEPPGALGYDGVERMPRGFLGQEVWPLTALRGKPSASAWGAAALMVGVTVGAAALW